MKLRVAAVACVVALGLAGCSGPKAPLNPPQLVTDLETDMSLQLFMQSTLLLSKYYGYQTIKYEDFYDRSTKAGFNTLPFMPPVSVRAVPALKDFAIDVAGTAAFRTEIKNSIGYKGLVAYYIKTGLRASQMVCRNYLLGLAEKNQYLEFLKREFGVAGTLADGVLNAVSANGTLLRSFALGRDGIMGGINAYEEYRFLNVDREAARILVETAQAKYANYYLDQLNKSSAKLAVASTGEVQEFFTFADALNAVSTMEYQCTRSGIQSLISRAVNNTPTNLLIDPVTGAVVFKSNLDALRDAITTEAILAGKISATSTQADIDAAIKAAANRIIAAQKADADKAAALKKAADEKAAADKKAAEDKIAADKAAAEKKAADEKAAADKLAKEREGNKK